MKVDTKQALIDKEYKAYQALVSFIEQIPLDVQEKNFANYDRDENIKDVLVHLYEWHLLLFHWIEEGVVKALDVAMPKKGYSWRMLDKLNMDIKHKHQNTSLQEAKQLLDNSFNQTLVVIKERTETELFTPRYYPFAKRFAIATFIEDCGANHYAWAIAQIKQHFDINPKESKY